MNNQGYLPLMIDQELQGLNGVPPVTQRQMMPDFQYTPYGGATGFGADMGFGLGGGFNTMGMDTATFMNGGLIPQNMGGNMQPMGFMDRVGQFGDWAANPSNQALLNAGGNAIMGLGNMIGGFQSANASKKMMNMQNDQWNKNFERQGSAYNEALYDRQRKRQSANPAAESPDSYVKKFGV